MVNDFIYISKHVLESLSRDQFVKLDSLRSEYYRHMAAAAEARNKIDVIIREVKSKRTENG